MQKFQKHYLGKDGIRLCHQDRKSSHTTKTIEKVSCKKCLRSLHRTSMKKGKYDQAHYAATQYRKVGGFTKAVHVPQIARIITAI